MFYDHVCLITCLQLNLWAVEQIFHQVLIHLICFCHPSKYKIIFKGYTYFLNLLSQLRAINATVLTSIVAFTESNSQLEPICMKKLFFTRFLLFSNLLFVIQQHLVHLSTAVFKSRMFPPHTPTCCLYLKSLQQGVSAKCLKRYKKNNKKPPQKAIMAIWSN